MGYVQPGQAPRDRRTPQRRRVCVCAKVSVGIGGSFARRGRVAAGMRSRRAGLVTDEGRVVGERR